MINVIYQKKYQKYGYVILRGVLTNEVDTIRSALLTYFDRKNGSAETGFPMEYVGIKDLIQFVPEAMLPQFNSAIIKAVKKIFEDFYYVNDLHVQRNAYIKDGVSGWHIDAGSNFSLKYFNNKLTVSEYPFARIGVYLQDKSCPIGASIHVIPRSHRYHKFVRSFLIRMLESKLNRWLTRLSEKLNLEHLLLPKKLDEVIQPGDCILFDCRLLHRSSGRGLQQLEHQVNNGNDKLTIYWEVGNKSSVEKYLFNDLARSLYYENVPRDTKPDKLFSDYLSLRYPDDYPDWYIQKCEAAEVQIGYLENSRHLDVARNINA